MKKRQQQNKNIYMNEIKDLLISRISDIKLLIHHESLFSSDLNDHSSKRSSKMSLQNPNTHQLSYKKLELQLDSHQSSFHVNNSPPKPDSQRYLAYHNLNRSTALIRKKQKNRCYKQQKLFPSLNILSFHNDKQLQEVYFHLIDILASFDSDFAKYKNPAHFLTFSMAENLKKVFSFFLVKHEQPQKCKQIIPQIMAREICDLSPAFFLGSIRKWSISILSGLLNLNEDKNECKIDIKVDLKKIQEKILNRNFVFQPYTKDDKNTFNFIKKNKSPRQSLQKSQNQIPQKKQFSFRTLINNLINQTNDLSPQIIVTSKQMVYAHCLDEMKKYYKGLPLEDLDIGYLRNIKKTGRREDLFSSQNIKNTVEVLTQTKNSQIKSLMTQFQSRYAKFKEIHVQFQAIKQPQKLPFQGKFNLVQQNQIFQNQRSSQMRRSSLKDLSIKNLKSIFGLNSKLLTPSHNQRQSYKNRIKFNQVKKQEILCESLTEHLTEELQKKASHSRFGDKSKLIDYNCVLTQQISEETTQIQNKIKLLKRINKKNKDLKEKYTQIKKKTYSQERNPETEGTQSFVDDHIEPIQKLSKLPKILSRDKTIQHRGESPQDFLLNKNYSVQKRSKQFSVQHYRLNKQSINKDHQLFFKQKSRASQQISGLTPWKSISPQKPLDKSSLNRRILSEAAEKQLAQNVSLYENQRPLSNFSFKGKSLGGSKKQSFNAIKINKNKNSCKNQFVEIQNVEVIHEKIKHKFGLKQNTTFDMKPHSPSNIFSDQKGHFVTEQGKKDEFIRYLKKLQKQKHLNENLKSSPSKQKKSSIIKKIQVI